MKNGFTLIELLAVIVILAIIALIATPVVLGIIEDSRKSSAINSAQLYVDGLSKHIIVKNLINNFRPSVCVVSNGEMKCDGVTLDYKVDGAQTVNGFITFEKNNTISNYILCMMNYQIIKTDKNVIAAESNDCKIFNGMFVEATSNDTHKGIVYLDPQNPGNECNASLAASNVNEKGLFTGVKTGCLKFYIYDDTGSNYKLILDHNTSSNVYWNSSGNNADGMNEVLSRLFEDTDGWIGSPRLIEANEVAHIVGTDREDTLNWDQSKKTNDEVKYSEVFWFYFDGSGNTYVNGWLNSSADSTNKSKYAWLYDNTYNCEQYGCFVQDSEKYLSTTGNRDIHGYWTSSAAIGTTENAWYVHEKGNLNFRYINQESVGVRPVITIPKALITFN